MASDVFGFYSAVVGYSHGTMVLLFQKQPVSPLWTRAPVENGIHADARLFL